MFTLPRPQLTAVPTPPGPEHETRLHAGDRVFVLERPGVESWDNTATLPCVLLLWLIAHPTAMVNGCPYVCLCR